eukprot:scaffold633_cov321-Pavlova_lutheri.AAC.9
MVLRRVSGVVEAVPEDVYRTNVLRMSAAMHTLMNWVVSLVWEGSSTSRCTRKWLTFPQSHWFYYLVLLHQRMQGQGESNAV